MLRILIVLVIALAVSGADPTAIRAVHATSERRCSGRGTDGVLVRLHSAKSDGRRLSKEEKKSLAVAWGERVRSRMRARSPLPQARSIASGPATDVHVHVEVVSEELAVLLARSNNMDMSSGASDNLIGSILDDDATSEVEANCVVALGREFEADMNKEPELGSFMRSRRLSHTSVQANPPNWGIDRIDSRSGLDQSYRAGNASGNGIDIYVLDTGVRVTHMEFGGRARAGWSYYCKTGSEAACGKDWLFGGVIDSSSSACSPHGTHCAATAAGALSGVAKHANIVAVQVLNCQGVGWTSGILAGMEWVIAQAAVSGRRSVMSMQNDYV
jgi:hypothetical protein